MEPGCVHFAGILGVNMGVGALLFRALIKLNRFLYAWLNYSLPQKTYGKKPKAVQEIVQELILIKTKYRIYSLPVVNNRALRVLSSTSFKEVSMLLAVDHKIQPR